jgi:hypothetical protein
MKKYQKQLLSVLFHGAVLATMVLAYDTGMLIARKVGLMKGQGEDTTQSTGIELVEKEKEFSKEIDPALAQLVSREGDAYLFRRDMPFPPHLKVVSTNVTKYDKARKSSTSCRDR